MSSEVIKKVYGNALVGVMNGTNNGIFKTVIRGATQAKTITPVDQGELRNSIGYTGLNGGKPQSGGYDGSPGKKAGVRLSSKPSNLQGYYGSALDYAHYVESGTRTMAPQAFLKPSANILTGSQTAQEVAKELNRVMNQEVKKGTKATRLR